MDRLNVFAVIALLILIAVGSAFTGCIEEDFDPKVEMTIPEAEMKEKDIDNNPPEEGHFFLDLNVSLENSGEDRHLYPVPRYFKLESDAGKNYTCYNERGMPDEIEPGETKNFWITFEIPKDEKGDILRYEPDWINEPLEAEVPGY
ncbi:MAG: DUF4352 domain-containing protein [Candidatus Natronoplasma sp.]